MARGRGVSDHGARGLGDDSHNVVRHLQESAVHLEPPRSALDALQPENPTAQQRNEGRMPREDADLPIECRCHDG